MIYYPTKIISKENPLCIDLEDADNPISLILTLDKKPYEQANDEDDILEWYMNDVPYS